MLCSRFLLLLIHPGSLNEDRHIYKIVEPVILTGVDIGNLDTKLFSVWIHKKQNKIHDMNYDP